MKIFKKIYPKLQLIIVYHNVNMNTIFYHIQSEHTVLFSLAHNNGWHVSHDGSRYIFGGK